MFNKVIFLVSILFLTSLNAQAQYRFNRLGNYEVTITNVTKGQTLTPAMVAIHNRRPADLFELAEPASGPLTLLAEQGDSSLLLDSLDNVIASQSTEGLIGPGESINLEFNGVTRARYLTVASMLIPTNDAFVAKSIRLPFRSGKKVTLTAYDAGTEINDELCANIPGPQCGGEGSSEADGEGFVHVHNGIHGVGDLEATSRDWNNPVAIITIVRR